MAELSSSKKISSNNNSSSTNNSNVKNVETSPVNGQKSIAKTVDTKKKDTRASKFSYEEDVFNSKKTTQKTVAKHTSTNPFITGASNISHAVRGNLINPVINTTNAAQQRVTDTASTLQANTQFLLQNFLARFVDIMDKIAAVFGEREKDIRDRISDTYKRIEISVHELLGPVDTAFEQKDHNKERPTKEWEEWPEEEEARTLVHRVD